LKQAIIKSKNLHRLSTEQLNPHSLDLDLKSSLAIARTINTEDAKVAAAVKRALPAIARSIDLVAEALSNGGRLIYVGAGTSGRIAALDAVECPPTFNTPPKMVQFVIAGGVKALAIATEANEDSRDLGRRAMAKRRPTKNDVVVGVAASGRTPFTVAALQYARRHGAHTIAVTCNRNSPLEKTAHLAIVAEVGPEVISGSTRMKAGTAQKMILGMISTGAMTRAGYVYGNLMVNVHLKNEKLMERGVSILQSATGISRKAAQKALKQSKNNLPVALVMLEAKVSLAAAARALNSTNGHVRQAIIAAHATGSR
jgi:N-acetylmuramic acid 6-phosphate etherase